MDKQNSNKSVATLVTTPKHIDSFGGIGNNKFVASGALTTVFDGLDVSDSNPIKDALKDLEDTIKDALLVDTNVVNDGQQ